jgi:hypothetical protein
MANQALQERIKKTQDENWEMLTVLGMPWSEAVKLTANDREYILAKVEELKEAQRQRQQLITDAQRNQLQANKTLS